MNEKLGALFSRRSVRKYKPKEIPDEMIRDLLEAAMAAPSAVAKDPWDFIIVKKQEIRDRIADALPNGQMLRLAPVGVVVCGNLERAHGEEFSYMLQDCSAAIENLLLAADMLGLGACWLGVHPREERVAELKGLFSLPENVIPVSCIALGWPEEHAIPRTRYRDDAVHYETW